jgi:superfamily II DNA or RNA helicase
MKRTEEPGSTGKRRTRKQATAAPRVSRLHQPPDMSLEEWQRELRRQFGREQKFELQNLGEHPIFSDFRVTNPASGSTYRVAIRDTELGRNFCSCGDFKTNHLGTCKHIEFTLAKVLSGRGAKRALLAGYEPAYSSISLEYGPQRHVRFRAGRDCPQALVLMAKRHFDRNGRLTPFGFGAFDRLVADARALDPELRIYDDVLPFVAEVRDTRQREQIIRAAFPEGAASSALNGILKHPLYDYQKEGALFAARAGRSLLGDEMGLGKTIQALAAAEIMARHLGVARVLIVCPASLKHQWEREIGVFSGRAVTVIQGARRARGDLFAGDSFFKITNYDTIHHDLEFIQRWSPDLVILDEAQRIKNWSTRAARSVKQIASPYAIVLTGTPLENRLEELISIVEFIDPFRLGPTFRFLESHQVKDENGRVIGYRDLDQVTRSLQSVVIRRRKSEVLKQLPERLEKHFFIPVTPQQRSLHEENREIVARIAAKWKKYHFLSDADQRRLMVALQNMRMVCDSTFLLDDQADHGTKADELLTILGEVLEEEGEKVVIFSQWLRMHEILQRRIGDRWGHVFFHGGVDPRKRRDLIDRFRGDPECRIFLSTDAGGVGLNLQHASVVVNVDLPWNPAVLEQRIGRVHRIGQRRPVRVINLVAEGTIEHGMLSVLRFKKSLFAGVLDGGETEVFLGNTRLGRFLDSVESVTNAVPRAQPIEAHALEEGLPEPTSRQAASAEEPSLSAAMPPEQTPPPATVALPTPAALPLAQFLESGVALLQSLSAALPPEQNSGEPRVRRPIEARRDESGELFLAIPMPRPETLNRVAEALHGLLAELTGR